MDKLFTIFGALILIVLVVVGFGLILSLPVMLLWNYCLVGAIAGVNEIGWLQAWGILVLCGFLFKASVSKS